MQFFNAILAIATLLPLTQACYRTTGYIQQYSSSCKQSTTYLPSIYLTKGGSQVCDGHFRDEQENPYNAAFVPGGIPTNSSFPGPFAAADCTSKSIQVDVQGINGQILIRDYETAFYINPENLDWKQVATGQGQAGIECSVASYWTWDSGDVHC